MRLLGLDVGSKTVGVAVSDPLGWTAQGLEIIPIDEERGNLGMGRLKQLVAEYQPDGFVLGLPKNMNNTEGPRVTQTKTYAERLVKKFGLPRLIHTFSTLVRMMRRSALIPSASFPAARSFSITALAPRK